MFGLYRTISIATGAEQSTAYGKLPPPAKPEESKEQDGGHAENERYYICKVEGQGKQRGISARRTQHLRTEFEKQ